MQESLFNVWILRLTAQDDTSGIIPELLQPYERQK